MGTVPYGENLSAIYNFVMHALWTALTAVHASAKVPHNLTAAQLICNR
jgi:hypothetical protein